MKFLIAMIFLILSWPASAQSGCAVNFAPESSKPKVLQSVLAVISSFNPKGEAWRLRELRNTVIELRQKKLDLADTLDRVSWKNSTPDWSEARGQQIPDIETRIVTLFETMHSEYDHGGLFAGDKSFADLSVAVDGKTKQLSQLCVLASDSLPLSPDDKRLLDSITLSLREEADTLGKIDGALAKLIQQTNEEAKSGARSQ
jgi:hypothetical protein